MATIVSAVRDILQAHEIPCKSVARRFETLYVAQESPAEVLPGFHQQVIEALGLATFDHEEAYYDKRMKLNYVWFTNLSLAGVEVPAISKPQAPLDALKDAFKRDSKKRKAKAPKNKLMDDMEEDEGLAGDGEIEDLEAPRSDLEDL